MVTRIGEFLLGQIGENDLLKASASAIPIKDQGQRCEAWYFIGMRKLEAGDKDAAIEALRKCVATQKVDYCEYILAQEALKSLGGGAVPPAPRAQAVSLPDPGTMAPPPSAPAPQ
jgi:lipoprotein NlpI